MIDKTSLRRELFIFKLCFEGILWLLCLLFIEISVFSGICKPAYA